MNSVAEIINGTESTDQRHISRSVLNRGQIGCKGCKGTGHASFKKKRKREKERGELINTSKLQVAENSNIWNSGNLSEKRRHCLEILFSHSWRSFEWNSGASRFMSAPFLEVQNLADFLLMIISCTTAISPTKLMQALAPSASPRL